MPLKIVYLDDEPDLCQIFEDGFGTMSGVEIQTFVDPEIALTAIEANLPDLIFVDYRLPKTNGVAVARRISPQVPIVLITGDLTMDLQAPSIRIFTKPYDFEEMKAFILSYVVRKPIR